MSRQKKNLIRIILCAVVFGAAFIVRSRSELAGSIMFYISLAGAGFDVVADAVQDHSGEAAMLSAWGKTNAAG